MSWTVGEKIGFWSLIVAVLSCPLLYQIPAVRDWLRPAAQAAGGAPVASQESETERTLEKARQTILDEERKRMEEEIKAAQEQAIKLQEQRIESRMDRIRSISERLYSGVQNPKYLKINLKNNCTEKVFIAVRYRDLDDAWVTRGWWTVEPGETRNTSAVTNNKVLYLYAENEGYTRFWTGENKVDSRTYHVTRTKKFYLVGAEEPLDDESRAVEFFKVQVGEGWGDYEHRFTCGNG